VYVCFIRRSASLLARESGYSLTDAGIEDSCSRFLVIKSMFKDEPHWHYFY
jgi:hypothetical protein